VTGLVGQTLTPVTKTVGDTLAPVTGTVGEIVAPVEQVVAGGGAPGSGFAAQGGSPAATANGGAGGAPMLGGVRSGPVRQPETAVGPVRHVLPADRATRDAGSPRASIRPRMAPVPNGADPLFRSDSLAPHVVTTAAVEVVAAGDAGSGGVPVGTGGVSGAGVAGPGPAPPGACAVIFAALFAAFAALLFAFVNAPAGFRSVQLVSLVERPG
jgi:hypothetical protein